MSKLEVKIYPSLYVIATLIILHVLALLAIFIAGINLYLQLLLAILLVWIAVYHIKKYGLLIHPSSIDFLTYEDSNLTLYFKKQKVFNGKIEQYYKSRIFIMMWVKSNSPSNIILPVVIFRSSVNNIAYRALSAIFFEYS